MARDLHHCVTALHEVVRAFGIGLELAAHRQNAVFLSRRQKKVTKLSNANDTLSTFSYFRIALRSMSWCSSSSEASCKQRKHQHVCVRVDLKRTTSFHFIGWVSVAGNSASWTVTTRQAHSESQATQAIFNLGETARDFGF